MTERLARRRMPPSVRAAQVLVTLHGILLCLPLAALYAISWLAHRESLGGGAVGYLVLATIVFPIGLVLIGTGLTGFPFWRISRWVASIVELGFAGILLWLAIVSNGEWPGKLLIPLAFGLIPGTLSVFLLTRSNANTWFRQL